MVLSVLNDVVRIEMQRLIGASMDVGTSRNLNRDQRPVSPEIIAGCDYYFHNIILYIYSHRDYFNEAIFSRVLLQRIHQLFSRQNIIATGDYFLVKLATDTRKFISST